MKITIVICFEKPFKHDILQALSIFMRMEYRQE